MKVWVRRTIHWEEPGAPRDGEPLRKLSRCRYEGQYPHQELTEALEALVKEHGHRSFSVKEILEVED